MSIAAQGVSKLAIVVVLGAALTALAVVLCVFAPHEKRGTRAVPEPSEAEESIAEWVPSVPTEAAQDPQREDSAPVLTAAPRVAREAPRARPPKRLDEASLIAKLHDLAASDPDQSLKLAREALKSFPDSPHAPEFQWNVVKALANMDRYQEAEEEARGMLRNYPDSPLSVDVEHHVLNHPPNPARIP